MPQDDSITTLSEETYDAVLAPELLSLAKKARDLGSQGVILYVTFDGGEGRTVEVTEEGALNPAVEMVRFAAEANGNADLLISALRRYAKKHGHNSCALGALDALDAI